jgi:hypothetical protein
MREKWEGEGRGEVGEGGWEGGDGGRKGWEGWWEGRGSDMMMLSSVGRVENYEFRKMMYGIGGGECEVVGGKIGGEGGGKIEGKM